jgi:hypothetical protein
MIIAAAISIVVTTPVILTKIGRFLAFGIVNLPTSASIDVDITHQIRRFPQVLFQLRVWCAMPDSRFSGN